MLLRPPSFSVIPLFCFLIAVSPAHPQTTPQSQQSPPPVSQNPKPGSSNATPPASQPSAEEALQLAVGHAGTDRAALVGYLESFLAQYPDYPRRSAIYRAIVEASIQLQDHARAADYAERMVALNPNDISTLILAVDLLERLDNQAAYRRAVNYSTRLLDSVNRTAVSDRSPHVSVEQWQLEKKGDLSNTYFLRGDLYLKLKEYVSARSDLQASYDTLPNAAAAQRLGETAELQKDLNSAIQYYARAFALSEGKNGNVSRQEIRQKIGNVWRLAHGSEDGLAEYLLRTFDEVTRLSAPARPGRNESVHELSEAVLRKAPDGAPYTIKDPRGTVVVLNFWATWCGPCHALEPLFNRVASEFHGLREALFLSANCDEDETLVAPYLQKHKPSTDVVFADGLDRAFAVSAFPTVIVIGRNGKIAFRSSGFQPDTFERELLEAVKRALAVSAAGQP